MTITLTPDLEQEVSKRAQELGMTPERLVLDRLREILTPLGPLTDNEAADKVPVPVDYLNTLPPPLNEWHRQLRSIGVPCGVSLTDEQVSRESLYEDHL